MPFPDKHFDVVACRFAMHQIQYPLDVIEEMFRVCKPGGKVVCWGAHGMATASKRMHRAYHRGG
jgi:ubiquinone/menaquinone biosynthesis C-methylase UbiE